MREANRAMRLMPPRITAPTMATIIRPMMKRSVSVFSMPMGVVNTVVTDSTSWLACMKHNVPTRPNIENATASGFHFSPNPLVIIYMGPPCTSPALSRPLYIIEREPSKNLVDMPTRALTHIQKTVPGPPIDNAMATPAMLPMPTVAAMALNRACTELIWPDCLPLSLACLSRRARSAHGKRLMDTAPEKMNRNNPPPISRKNSG